MAKYTNYCLNLEVLSKADEQDLSNEFIQSGIIDKFSMQFELAWKLLQKTLRYEGMLEGAIGSPRGIIKTANKTYDFIDEDVWLEMLDARNEAEHVYDSEMAQRLVNNVIEIYIDAFERLKESLQGLYGDELLASMN